MLNRSSIDEGAVLGRLDRSETGRVVFVARRPLVSCLAVGLVANFAQNAAQFGYRAPGGWLYYHTSDFIHGFGLSLAFFASMVRRWAATICIAAVFLYSLVTIHLAGGGIGSINDVRTFVVDNIYFLLALSLLVGCVDERLQPLRILAPELLVSLSIIWIACMELIPGFVANTRV
jgi:hypothetical protein